MIRYNGYLIWGKAVRVRPNGLEWWGSQAGVFTSSGKNNILIKHLDEGFIFESKEGAEAHGLELCKKRVDENYRQVMTYKKAGADFQSRFNKATAQAEQMKKGLTNL
jgi:hypothetical protein